MPYAPPATNWPVYRIFTHQELAPDTCYCDRCFGHTLEALLVEERHQSVRHLAKRMNLDPGYVASLILDPKAPQGFVCWPN